ncbi:hypothetical protein [Luteimonas marina]|nr:hypothetical protein [Luteimonas marina]
MASNTEFMQLRRIAHDRHAYRGVSTSFPVAAMTRKAEGPVSRFDPVG